MFRRRLLPLVIVAAAFAGAIWFLRARVPTTEGAREKAARLIDIEPQEATRIESHGAGNDWVLTKKGGRWTLESPVAAPADEGLASGIVLDLCRIRIEGKIPEPVDRKAFGLDPPVRTVTVTADGKKTIVRIGKAVAGLESVAVELEGTTGVFAAQRSVETSASRPARELREKQILKDTIHEVVVIGIARPAAKPYRLEKRNDGWWIRVDPFPPDYADEEKVRPLLDGLLGVRVLDFLEERAANRPSGWIQIDLETRKGEKHTLFIEPPAGLDGPPIGKQHIEFDGELSMASTTFPRDLPSSPRSLFPLGGRGIDVRTLTVRRGTVERTFEKSSGGEWLTGGKKVSAEACFGAIESLTKWKGKGFSPPNKISVFGISTATPGIRITIRGENGDPIQVDFFNGQQTMSALWNRRRTDLLLYPKDDVARMVAPIEKLFDLEPELPVTTVPVPAGSSKSAANLSSPG